MFPFSLIYWHSCCHNHLLIISVKLFRSNDFCSDGQAIFSMICEYRHTDMNETQVEPHYLSDPPPKSYTSINYPFDTSAYARNQTIPDLPHKAAR
jgi:hypothetical protein